MSAPKITPISNKVERVKLTRGQTQCLRGFVTQCVMFNTSIVPHNRWLDIMGLKVMSITPDGANILGGPKSNIVVAVVTLKRIEHQV
jgi:hypothetical protein